MPALFVGCLLFVSCEEKLREAGREDALSAASACQAKVEHFGTFYVLGEGDVPDNGIWITARGEEFRKQSDCLERELKNRGVRAIIAGPRDHREVY